MSKRNWSFMAGTEKTGEYVVVARTSRGKVGIRDLGCGRYRIRVEPFGQRFVKRLEDNMSTSSGWKQPGDDGQLRFSSVTCDLKETLHVALEAIGYKNLVSKTNDAMPDWAREVMPA